MADLLHQLLWTHGKFLGITWSVWKIVGWAGNGIFFSRFIVQWYATEKQKKVVVPLTFWWLSLAGTLVLLLYATFYEKDSVFIMAYAFNWIPYIRNLIIHARHQKKIQVCPDCGAKAAPDANFCGQCGTRLAGSPAAAVH